MSLQIGAQTRTRMAGSHDPIFGAKYVYATDSIKAIKFAPLTSLKLNKNLFRKLVYVSQS